MAWKAANEVISPVRRSIQDYEWLDSTLAGPEAETGDPAVSPSAALPQFDGFRTIERLGRGGGGEVYKLEDLELGDLIALWAECRGEDAQSAAVLEAYLDRTQGEAWREAAAQGGAGPRAPAGAGAMSQDEACDILGLEPGAGRAAIHEAHRRLMQKVHPDHGGSNYLAAKINQAKALLLGE